MSSYLSLRAIDEIEDHPQLNSREKVSLLHAVSRAMKKCPTMPVSALFKPYRDQLAEVTCRLDEWTNLAPKEIAPTIYEATAVMAHRMAYWVENNWSIRTKHDLDRYTFDVAGAVGVLLSDLWAWYDGTASHKNDAIAYGRGLQAINILRNRPEDLARGVNFFPIGWTEDDFHAYARSNLPRGDKYVTGFPPGPAREFCSGPQTLAYATLDALARGESKLSRSAVLKLIETSAVNSNAELLSEQPGAREEVILVNEKDEVIGVEEKIKTHFIGALHRAFSVFVFNSSGQLLLQKRTNAKYHSGGLWSNTCCGHPRPGEPTEQASRRRLREEMGFDSEVREVFNFIYHTHLECGLFEHEYDHVFLGKFDGVPSPNQGEVADWKWVDLSALRLDMKKHPQHYTYWLKASFDDLCQSLSPISNDSLQNINTYLSNA